MLRPLPPRLAARHAAAMTADKQQGGGWAERPHAMRDMSWVALSAETSPAVALMSPSIS